MTSAPPLRTQRFLSVAIRNCPDMAIGLPVAATAKRELPALPTPPFPEGSAPFLPAHIAGNPDRSDTGVPEERQVFLRNAESVGRQLIAPLFRW
jgi:hypothetical protein